MHGHSGCMALNSDVGVSSATVSQALYLTHFDWLQHSGSVSACLLVVCFIFCTSNTHSGSRCLISTHRITYMLCS